MREILDQITQKLLEQVSCCRLIQILINSPLILINKRKINK